MKKLFLSASLCFAVLGSAFAQQPLPVVSVQDSISTNTHWTMESQYLLKGYVYVTAGATLTIDPGVVVFGDKATKGALIVERGAKIIANGTPDKPIVFTSHEAMGNRNYGDWGGVIICGKSPVNWTAGEAQVEGGPRSFYGGTDPHDNSGSMTYCRVEFAGIAFSPNNEVNGLTFAGVGDGTTLHHLQVSYSGDDSYEWFGGTTNGKYFVSLGAWDDDFDTDCGYTGKNQFFISLRDPYAADLSGSKAFESDSYQSGTASGLNGDTTHLTKPVFSNCTIVGPLNSPTSTAYDANYVSALHIRRGSALSLMNSIVAGYPAGILIDESSSSFGSTVANIGSDILQVRNTLICGIPTNSTPTPKELVYVINGARSLTPTTVSADTTTGTPFNPYPGPFSWFLDPAHHNKIYATLQGYAPLHNPFNLTNPSFAPNSTNPVVYNSAHAFNPENPLNSDTSSNYAHYNMPAFAPDFSSYKLADAFFDHVNFVGAIGGSATGNWATTWTEWDPNNKDYTQYGPSAVTSVNANMESVQAYPNPTKQFGHVSFKLSQNSNVVATLVDVQGNVVKEIFNGKKEAGKHLLNIDLSDVAAGMYMVSVKTETEIKTVKIVVTK